MTVSICVFFIPSKKLCVSKVLRYMVMATETFSYGGSYSMKLESSAMAILLS